jgi:hypothetical protein
LNFEGAPVYVYENLNLEDTRKQILNDTRGLSGIYMIVNKTTKDYYIGSAATNRFYARFCNHVINFTGSKIVKLVGSCPSSPSLFLSPPFAELRQQIFPVRDRK